jgi:putative ABC transport system permease protein
MDNTKEQFYKSEQRALKLSTTAVIIAIIISCLGLFGLASYSTVQRTKEIGIRKVLGSSNKGIVALLSKEFLTLVIVAFILAGPIAYWLGITWLQDFAYKLPISPWIFVSAFTGSLLIAFFTVSYQSIRAALANPANSLRYE